MSRRSRRKTLSHADLEDFLCDLGQEADPIVDLMDIVDCKIDNHLKLHCDSSHSTEPISMSDEQQIRDFCKVINLIRYYTHPSSDWKLITFPASYDGLKLSYRTPGV